MEHRPLIIIAALIMLAFAATLVLRNTGKLEGLELKAYDSYLGLADDLEGPHEPIVMVEYTESDEAAFGYPLPDASLAKLLAQLAADEPVAIGLDLIRDRPEPQVEDTTAFDDLSSIFRDHPSIVGTMKGGSGAFGPPPALEDRPFQVGSVAILTEPDGRTRRGLLNIDEGEAVPRPSLALLLATRYLASNDVPIDRSPDGRLTLGSSTISPLRPQETGFYSPSANLDGGDQFLLNFPACASGFERHQIKEILDDPDSLDVDGRIVLIGNTVRAAKDVFDVPLVCAGMTDDKMFGVHLHGQIISQLI
ncbi:MAG: CHASE2 domain-containing protein, partial [Geminicoccaceae bacterium]